MAEYPNLTRLAAHWHKVGNGGSLYPEGCGTIMGMPTENFINQVGAELQNLLKAMVELKDRNGLA